MHEIVLPRLFVRVMRTAIPVSYLGGKDVGFHAKNQYLSQASPLEFNKGMFVVCSWEMFFFSPPKVNRCVRIKLFLGGCLSDDMWILQRG